MARNDKMLEDRVTMDAVSASQLFGFGVYSEVSDGIQQHLPKDIRAMQASVPAKPTKPNTFWRRDITGSFGRMGAGLDSKTFSPVLPTTCTGLIVFRIPDSAAKSVFRSRYESAIVLPPVPEQTPSKNQPAAFAEIPEQSGWSQR